LLTPLSRDGLKNLRRVNQTLMEMYQHRVSFGYRSFRACLRRMAARRYSSPITLLQHL
jgi:hypothetical protein